MRKVVDKNIGTSLCGVVDVDGNEVIPVNFLAVNMDENGFVSCYGEGNDENAPSVLYTYNGRRQFSWKAGSSVKNDTKHKVFIIYDSNENDGLSEYRVLYYDGTEVMPPVKASSLFFEGNTYWTFDLATNTKKEGVVNDYNPKLHSEHVIDRQDFLLPIRESILGNEWIRMATSFCDAGKWEEALMCLYQFNNVDYQKYMQAVPECLLFATMWLTCNKELGLTDVIKKEFDDLIGYNIHYFEEKIEPTFVLEDAKLQEELLEQCREIALPILIPDYEAKMEQARLAQIQAEKEHMKRLKEAQKAERRQRRAEIWGAILTGLSQALYNVSSSYYAATRPSQAISVPLSHSGTYNINTSHSSGADTSSSSNNATATRKKCTRCNGSGTVVIEHSHNSGYGLDKKMKTCSQCGKSYDSFATSHRHERCSSCHGTGYWEFK